MSVALKVCGLTRRADLDLCVQLGVDAVGLNFWPRSKRTLTLEEGRKLVEGVERRGVQVVGVFVEASPRQVQEIVEACALDAVQLHGDQTWAEFADVGALLVRVIRGTPELASLVAPKPTPAWTILDAAVAGYGGQGHRTDWDWAAAAVEGLADHPTWLAGGIRPDNAAEAIAKVGPAGLDVASGVEETRVTRGEKDAAKIEALLAAC